MHGQIMTAINLDDPPVDPPPGCADSFLWRLARERFEEHRPMATGECPTCPRWKRCPGTSLAKDGLATALGQTVKESPYWTAYGQVTAGADSRVDRP